MIELTILCAIVIVSFASTIYVTGCEARDKRDAAWRDWLKGDRREPAPDGLDTLGLSTPTKGSGEVPETETPETGTREDIFN